MSKSCCLCQPKGAEDSEATAATGNNSGSKTKGGKSQDLHENGTRIQALTLEDSLKADTGNGNGSAYKIKQLFNRHGYNLAILRGHVKGELTKDVE